MLKKLSSLRNNQNFMKYFQNTSWLLADKILKMVVLLFVNILIARYLGPGDFGFLSYSISIVVLFAMATHLGLGGLVIKELVSSEDTEEIIGTVFYIKLLGAIIGFSILLAIDFLTEDIYSMKFFVLLVISLSIFLKPFEVVDFWFTANVKSKFTAITNTSALLISSILKIIFVFANMGLIWFAGAYFVEASLIAIFFIYFVFTKTNINVSLLKFSFEKAKYLLSKSWMIMLGGLFAIIYLKIDQIMLKWMVGNESVGIYAVAASLSEVWYFLPTIIVTSLFPKIIEMKENNSHNYNERLQQLYDFLFIIALGLALVVSFIATDLVVLLYGEEYKEAGAILSIHIWAGVFIFMRALFSKWIIVEDILVFSLITQGFGAFSNIILNFILIPQYGIYGAAIATLTSYAMASYFVLIFYSKTRSMFWMMSKAMISPLRYLILGLQGKKNG